MSGNASTSETTWIVRSSDPVLVTGAAGFIGRHVVRILLDLGFDNVRCFVRPTSNLKALEQLIGSERRERIQLVEGDLLNREDCRKAAEDSFLVYHLAAGVQKSFAGAYMNSVVATRNLLEALDTSKLKRLVNVSSFAVYSNAQMKRGQVLDESCPIESPPHRRHEAYAYAKIKQDELVVCYAREAGIPYTIVRPGAVFGPGKPLTGRCGIDTFGVFLHLGGANLLPLTYVENCAEAIVLAGLKAGADGEVFNVVDDELPTSRVLLRSYKRGQGSFFSIPVPYPLAYGLCTLWEKYAAWSEGQLPPVFNRSRCSANWKGNLYSNARLKQQLGWTPRVPMSQAIERAYFDKCDGSWPSRQIETK